MDLQRREFLKLSVAAAGLAAAAPVRLLAKPAPRIRAVLFDAFPVFDPRPVFALAKEMFPAQGQALTDLWRTKQFEYTWLRTVSGTYQNFWDVTRDALHFSAEANKLELGAADEERLMGAYLRLQAWPDVLPALRSLKDAGLRLGFLSNFTADMLQANIHSAGLDGFFDPILSTDQAGAFKPDPRAYRLGADTLHLAPSQIVFAAFAGWDAAGAKTFGYPTYWVNRLAQPAEELGVTPDASSSTLTELVSFVKARNAVT
jgi:2-haloacid dehalogenase